jgi:hypothetical protein
VTVQRTSTPAVIVIPTVLPNGQIEIALQPTYVLGGTTRRSKRSGAPSPDRRKRA